MHGQIMLERQQLTHKMNVFFSFFLFKGMNPPGLCEWEQAPKLPELQWRFRIHWRLVGKYWSFRAESSESGQDFWHTHQLQLQNVFDTVLSEHISTSTICCGNDRGDPIPPKADVFLPHKLTFTASHGATLAQGSVAFMSWVIPDLRFPLWVCTSQHQKLSSNVKREAVFTSFLWHIQKS